MQKTWSVLYTCASSNCHVTPKKTGRTAIKVEGFLLGREGQALPLGTPAVDRWRQLLDGFIQRSLNNIRFMQGRVDPIPACLHLEIPSNCECCLASLDSKTKPSSGMSRT